MLASLLTATGLLLSQQQPDPAAATAPPAPAPVVTKKKSGIDRQRDAVRRQLGDFLDSPDWFFWRKPLSAAPPAAAPSPAEEPAPAADTTKK